MMTTNKNETLPEVNNSFGQRLVERFAVIIGLLAYIYLYNWLYIKWLAPTWSYFNFTYTEPPTSFLILAWTLSMIPALWMPLTLRRASQLTYWILYMIVYIPSMFGPLYMRLRPLSDIRDLMITLFFGLIIIGLPYLLPLPKFGLKPLPRTVFWVAMTVVVVLMNLFVYVTFRGKLQLVSFEDVYAIRTVAKSIMATSLVGYAIMPLAVTLDPILMAAGLVGRRMWLFFAGMAGQILIYAATGLKSVLLSVVAAFLGYIIAKHFSKKLAMWLVWSTVAMFIGLCLIVVRTPENRSIGEEGILFLIMGRTYAMTGMLSGQYHDFFMHHPLTHLSHAKPFNLIAQYPYKYSLGYEIGAFYKGGSGVLNENVHFWMSDGMASFGLAGIIMISVLVAVVFWMLDAASEHHRIAFSCAFLGYVGFQLTNLPVLTILGSGGLGIGIFLLYWMSDDAVPVDHGWFYRILGKRKPKIKAAHAAPVLRPQEGQ